ncbi:MAG: cysteine desulfurase [Spirochaetales bacterium]|nr:cysteine desulfurase [Spirochaetales bacterium]
MERLYFDWAATSKPDPEILEQTVRDAIDFYGNPSSSHSEGKKASELLSTCRKKVATELNCKAEQIIFTSGGTESNNLIIFSLLNRRRQAGEILISGFEHAAVYEPAKSLKDLGWKLNILPPLKEGAIDPDSLIKAYTIGTEFISLMAVNNETGVILPVRESVGNLRQSAENAGKEVFIHTDGVQALGKQKIDLTAWDVDAASFSGHKIGAPRGCGILFLKNPKAMLNRGGGQEMGLRGGTENLPGIHGLSLAIEKKYANLETDLEHAKEIKRFIVNNLIERANAKIIPTRDKALSEGYSPWIVMVSFPQIPGEVLARVINDKGAAVSTGSACSSRQKKTFRVSDSLGISRDIAFSAIRISWGADTSLVECEALIKIFENEVELLRRVTGRRR